MPFIIFLVILALYILLMWFLIAKVAPYVFVYGSVLVSLVVPACYGYTLYEKYRSKGWRDVFFLPVYVLISLITLDISSLLFSDLLTFKPVGGGYEILQALRPLTALDSSSLFGLSRYVYALFPHTEAGFHFSVIFVAMLKSIPIMPFLLLVRGLRSKETDPRQPAYVQYFFRGGFIDLKEVCEGFVDHVTEVFAEIGESIWKASKGGQMWFLWPLTFTAYIALIPPAIAAVIFSVVLIVFHLIGLLVVLAVCAPVALLFALMERAVMLARRGYVKCPHAACHQPLPLPVYVCPSCGKRHDRLIPGRFGVFIRVCQCGQRLPTFFWFGKGRLLSFCPHCEKALPSKLFTGSVHIPIYGGTAAGKTMFMMASIYEMIEGRLDGLEVTHIREQDREKYEKVWKVDFESGRVREKTASTLPNAFLLSLRRRGGLTVSLYLYDPAGEAMVSPQDLQGHRFLKYYDSLALIIDPLTIGSIAEKYRDQYPQHFPTGAGRPDPQDVVQHVVNELERQARLSRVKRYNRRLAVLVSKADLPFVAKELAIDLSGPDREGDWKDVETRQSQSLQKWLAVHEPALLQQLRTQFSDIRFFAISSLGGDPKPDVAFKPRNVRSVLHFLLAKQKTLVYPRISHVGSRFAEFAAAAVILLAFMTIPYIAISFAADNFDRVMARVNQMGTLGQLPDPRVVSDTPIDRWTEIPLVAESFASSGPLRHSVKNGVLTITPSRSNYTWIKQGFDCERLILDCDAFGEQDRDIYIALAATDMSAQDCYEIVIGGRSNSRTLLRRSHQGPIVAESRIVNNKKSWQKVRIVKDRNVLIVYLNGALALKYEDLNPGLGRFIGFSSWDNRTFFKKIEIASPRLAIQTPGQGDNPATGGAGNGKTPITTGGTGGGKTPITTGGTTTPVKPPVITKEPAKPPVTRPVTYQYIPKTDTLELFANNGVQSGGIMLKAGDSLLIDVAANVTIMWADNAPWCGPNGSGSLASARNDGGRFLCPIAPCGAVIGRIGTSGKWFLVGGKYRGVSDRDGELFLAINDLKDGFVGNFGSFVLTIVRGARQIKSASLPEADSSHQWYGHAGTSDTNLRYL